MVKILFVCLGNICRSPTAHGVFQKLLQDHSLEHQIMVDSAGTHAYHIGKAPDSRSQEAAKRRGVDLSPLRARQVTLADFDDFDYVLAMDEENLMNLEKMCPPEHGEKVRLFLDFASDVDEREVPDPYYGGARGFERVLDLVEAAAAGLLEDVRQRYR